ncbi:PAAF1-like protein [Mya arenaria]|uniref:PAAF1-like protein n=1 Tax=Mya arenaria TaxID=6604 RepID=A0ABY7ED32_MYAAR|nr:proteasomal ATPase-associated factor 1-like [Mya arenaria]WAR06857.1 PAAF1-like protein [Mya arenaria]
MAASRVILQSDFNSALRDKDGKAWISYKCQGKDSIHSYLKTTELSESRIPYVSSSDGFSVQSVSERRIDINFENDGESLRRTFIAPAMTFSSIHKERKSVHCMDVTLGGLGVSSDSEGRLKVWESGSGDVRRDLEGHFGDVYTCQFFPSGIVILTGGADMQLKIWSAETGQCAATLRGHKAGILETAIVDRGRNIVSCARDGTSRLWDCSTQQCLVTVETEGGNVNCCTLQATPPDYDLGTQSHTPGEQEVGTAGKLLLLGCERGYLQGYGLQTRQKVFELDCHDAVNCCRFVSETCVACGTQDGHITITDIRNIRMPLREWKETRNAILSILPYKGGFFTSTGDGSCFYVDQSQETVLELCGADCDPVYRAVSDGAAVYTACRDGLIRKYQSADIDQCLQL